MKKSYLIAVSGGPDSMALLNMYRLSKANIEVAHVNYHKRDTALRDENIVKSYCKKYSIKFNKLDVYPEEVQGNFQAYARKVRYEFFASICKKHHLNLVLIAHHKDDNIETYLMQKDKKLGVTCYGLAEYNTVYDAKIYRPLLKYTKRDLISYCDKRHIVYGIDESNLSDDYQRNRIRHHQVEKMSDNQKDEIVNEINERNNLRLSQINEAMTYLKDKDFLTVEEFKNIPNLKEYLRNYVNNKSDKHLDEIIRQLCTCKRYIYSYNDFYITKEYNYINMFMAPKDYCYEFKNIEELKSKKYEYFCIRKKGTSFQSVTINENDFPIVIRNVKAGDFIKMKYGTKKLSRFFIDRKINLKKRMSWPIVINKNGIAILVPEIGCNIDHYSKKPNLFVIEL